MKKFLFIFVLVVLLISGGCTPTEKKAGKTAEELLEIKTWLENEIPLYTNEDLELPFTHPELGGEIEWESIDKNVLKSTGEITLTSGSKDVILNYVISYDGDTLSDYFIITVYGASFDDVAAKFKGQFAAVIARDYDVRTEYDGYTINWTSSNPEIFSNEGKYTKPNNDETITIVYEVELNGEIRDYSFEIVVKGLLASEKREKLVKWINDNYLQSKLITSELELPTYNEEFKAPIHWESSNPNVISSDGKITRYPFDRYISLTGVARVQDEDIKFSFSVIVAAKEVTTKEEKVNALIDAIALKEIGKLTFLAYGNINQTFNFLPFYENVDAPVTVKLMPKNSERPGGGGSRPGTKLTSVEFITIHDTASTPASATAEAHANLLINGFSASWHYAIDEDGAFQSIPLDEVAWHAGDGSRTFGLTDTGVKANGPYPEITISKDGYFEINGEKTKILAPTSDGRILTSSHITPSGIYTEIGENGNYYINNTYYNKDYAKISNHGGNRNSIGIESCVNYGSNYQMTVRHLAKLCAELLIMHDLNVDRVLQHNNFSGKPCPNSIRTTGYWDNFLDLISMEKFAKEELSDVEFIWESLTPIMDNKGMISLNIGDTKELNYKVTAKFDGHELTRTATTKILS
jgi:N-acetylmuramoyl-L-alanine amidase CwlA